MKPVIHKSELSEAEPMLSWYGYHWPYKKSSGTDGDLFPRGTPTQKWHGCSSLPTLGHITESTQLFGTMENSMTEFSIESPTWTNTSEFKQSVEVRSDTKSESALSKVYPTWTFSPGRDPYTVVTSFLVSRLVSCYYPVLTDASFYHVNDVKIHTPEQHLKYLGSYF